jgi:monofunctional glycosyltransferase
MATQAVLKCILWLAGTPIFVASFLVERVNCGTLRIDLAHCLRVVDSAEAIPEAFIRTLVAAEDHRNALHPGVDAVGIMRGILAVMRRKRMQGGSTIEQQLVRTVTGRFERTTRRKIREQVLAVALSRRRSKRSIAAAYLSIAFYGSQQYGVVALRKGCGNLEVASQNSITSMIARLKYPEPLCPSPNWQLKLEKRCAYIGRRMEDTAKRARRQLTQHPRPRFIQTPLSTYPRRPQPRRDAP